MNEPVLIRKKVGFAHITKNKQAIAIILETEGRALFLDIKDVLAMACGRTIPVDVLEQPRHRRGRA